MRRILFSVRHTSGFTMIELLIVIVVLGLLTVASGTAYVATMRTSRDGRRKVDMETIRSALEIYRADTSTYPVTYPEAVSANVTLRSVLDPASGKKYISMPSDPRSGEDYAYVPANCEDIGATRVCNGYLLGVALEHEPAQVPDVCGGMIIDSEAPCFDANGGIAKCTYCVDPYGVVMPEGSSSPDPDIDGQKTDVESDGSEGTDLQMQN